MDGCEWLIAYKLNEAFNKEKGVEIDKLDKNKESFRIVKDIFDQIKENKEFTKINMIQIDESGNIYRIYMNEYNININITDKL